MTDMRGVVALVQCMYSLLKRIVEDGVSICPNKIEPGRAERSSFFAHKNTINSFFSVKREGRASKQFGS